MTEPRESLTKFNVYCDEAGNSGPNLLDPSQPIYVIAGWVCAWEAVDDAVAAVSSYKTLAAPGASELKGARLFSHRRGRNSYEDFIKNVGLAGPWPVFAIFEKKYWIAGKIVDILFDPFHNPSSNWSFFDDFDQKRKAADEISEWPMDYLVKFAEAIRGRNIDDLRACIESFERISRLLGSGDHAHRFAGALQNLEVIHAREVVTLDSDNHGLETVNVPSLVAFIELLEGMGRYVPNTTLHITHDASLEFGHHYEWIFGKLKNATPGVFTGGDGTTFYSGFESVVSFNTADSSSSELLQAADLLANGLFRYAKAASTGETIEPWLVDALAMLFLGAVPSLIKGPQLVHLMGSPKFLDNLLGPTGNILHGRAQAN